MKSVPRHRKMKRKSLIVKVPRRIRFRQKLSALCKALRVESKLFTGRISPKNIIALRKKNLCVLLQNDKEIFGIVLLWPTVNPHYFELGTLWVRPGYRRYGHSASLFEAVLKLAPKGSNVFLITNEEKVIRLAEDHKWDEASGWQSSEVWRKVYEPWQGSICRKDPSSTSRLFYTIISSE